MGIKMNVNSIAVDARLESAYGAGAGVPVTTAFESANLLFRNKTPFDVNTEEVNLNPLSTSFTDPGSTIGAQTSTLKPGFNLQSYGSSLAGYRLDAIYRMCGMARTTPGAGTAAYKFRSDGFESGELCFFEGAVSGNGLLHRIVGCYGTLTWAGTAGQPITIEADLQGFYGAATSLAAPTLTLPASNIATMKAASCTIAIAGGSTITPVGKSFSLSQGWPINPDDDFNAASGRAGYLLGKREPRLQMVIGMTPSEYIALEAAKDAESRITTVFTHTDSDGGKTRFTIKTRIAKLTKGEQNDYGTLTIDQKLSAATAEDELLIECWKP